MRLIDTHKTNPANRELLIEVLDKPGSGGANHNYAITNKDGGVLGHIQFQNGPIKEAGVNGITHEALLAILIDRLHNFQTGPFANDYNQIAMAHCTLALEALKARTRERESRGVEGTHVI